MVITVDYRPSGRGQRTHTKPWAVVKFDGRTSETERRETREQAMERAAALAGVKL